EAAAAAGDQHGTGRSVHGRLQGRSQGWVQLIERVATHKLRESDLTVRLQTTIRGYPRPAADFPARRRTRLIYPRRRGPGPAQGQRVAGGAAARSFDGHPAAAPDHAARAADRRWRAA